MLTQKNTGDGDSHTHAQSVLNPQAEKSVQSFIHLYNSRSTFFDDSFIRKIKEGNRKAFTELLRFPLPPTQMDLRKQLEECIKANVPDDYSFSLKDGKSYRMDELRRLVPAWATLAEKALMDSDPALADKLMTQVQWNAKSAFEVTFSNALNELRELKKMKNSPATVDHYFKWTVTPLRRALDEVKAVNAPGNALIGYGERVSLNEAIKTAESLENEFLKVLRQKGAQ